MLWLDLTPGDGDDVDDCPTLVTQGRFEGVKLFRRQGGEWTEVASFHVPHTGFCRGYLERTEEGGGGDTVAVVPSGQSTVMVARLVASFIRPVVSLQREAAGSLMCLAPGPASARGRLLAGYEAGHLVLWDWSNNTPLVEVTSLAPLTGTLLALAWDWAKGRGVVAGSEAKVVVLDSEGFAVTKSRDITNPGVGSAAVRHDGKVVVCGGWDGRLRLFSWLRPDKLKPLAVLRFHSESVEALLCARNIGGRDLILAGGRDGRISIWDIY